MLLHSGDGSHNLVLGALVDTLLPISQINLLQREGTWSFARWVLSFSPLLLLPLPRMWQETSSPKAALCVFSYS